MSSWIPPVIPAPVFFQAGEGTFDFEGGVCVVVEGEPLEHAVAALGAVLSDADVDFSGANGVRTIRLRLDDRLPLGPEGYLLECSSEGIGITGKTERGVFYGIQTLRQLPDPERPWQVPSVIIRDEPRFGWRGAMLDCGRHLFSVEELKRFLDAMALQKLNVLHWHLTEDQGWRIEIKRYPKLTETGAWREQSPVYGDRKSGDGRPYGGFYTQEEVREVVAYAAARFITVVPEIELPGHASAAIAAYPELGNDDIPGYAPKVQTRWGVHHYTYAPKEETFRFLEAVFNEIFELFPSPYIHIGGDEAPKDQWKESPFAQSVMRREGLADEHALQSWFIRRIERYLNAHGRKLIGWDEIQEGGLSPTATMMVWRDWKWARQALSQGNAVVMSPMTHCYLDFYQADPAGEPEAIGGLLMLEQVYSLDPVPPGLDPALEKLILGVQGNLWSEYIPDFPHLGYMAFPRLSALAEAGWTPLARKDYASFSRRVPGLMRRLERLGVNHWKPRTAPA